jgi:hypothetical protein
MSADLVGRSVSKGFRAVGFTVVLVGMLGSAGCLGLTGSRPSKGSGGPLSASSTSVSFGDVTVGTSTAQLITLTDTGDTNISISSVSATGSGFNASGASNMILTPNQSVTVSVNFSPTAAGGVTGKLSIASDAANTPLEVPLSGTGIAPTVQHSVTLNWQPSTSQVMGYFIYRTSPSGGALSRLNPSAELSTTYTDRSVAGGENYLYAVTSVDYNNVESGFSDQVSVTIPSP